MFLRRPLGVGLEDFRRIYLEDHANQVLEQPGVQGYVANLTEEIPQALTQAGFGNPGTGVDAVDELWCAPEQIPLDVYAGNGVLVGAYRVNERVMRGYQTTWPVGQRSPWLKRIALLRRADRMSHEEFGDYWSDQHAPLALVTHRMIQYVQNLITSSLTIESSQWDGIVQTYFWSVDDFVKGFFPHPEDREVIMTDVRKFVSDWEQQTTAWHLGEYIMRPLGALRA